MEQTNTKSEQIELGALWKKEGKGQKFLSGTIKRSALPEGNEDIQVVIFSNKFKKADNHPDLRMYLSKPRASAAPVAAQAPIKKVVKTVAAPVQQEEAEELI
jgi:uncharacterized protein (DUF736 family)